MALSIQPSILMDMDNGRAVEDSVNIANQYVEKEEITMFIIGNMSP
jgi:hypothetical protein